MKVDLTVAGDEEQVGLPPITPPDPAALLCTFDSWVWVQLAAARRYPDHELRGAWESLLAATNAGKIQVALTSGSYLELWNRANQQSRQRVAIAMAELTGYTTIRAVHEVVVEEAIQFIQTRRQGLGLQAAPLARVWMLGTGARHAFASRAGRFRFVESLADTATPEGPEIEAPPELLADFDRASPEWFEWLNLAGVDNAYDVEGIDYRPTHREGDEWVDVQEQLRAFATRPGSEPSLLYRGLVRGRLKDVFGQLGNDAITPRERAEWFTGPNDGVKFITALPVQRVIVELLHAAHRNKSYAFRQHDRVDVHELALTVPYCDVVVPDSHWAHLAHASRVDVEHCTLVVRGLKGFRAWAEGL
ncbi:hypothetical protein DXT68_00225 [Microbacterium foliorum]|uniref:Uncharacterized protein n=1 Tax=Microbacterium foliorum TaxID=104336 RepID=A0A0F0KMW3_9MICO|nr:hypothetical protein DXT68_00225 [Microbacterium foliorum]KJL21779.1 hypothetical protein RN50_01680 [Microbacterium foliorum]